MTKRFVAKVVLNNENEYEYDDEYEKEPPCSTSSSYSSSYSTIVFLRLKTIIVKVLETSVPAYAGKRSLFALSSFAAAGNSGPQKDLSGRKTTRRRYRYGGHASHVEGVVRQSTLFAKSSALSPYFS
jgi:hypothetical protein